MSVPPLPFGTTGLSARRARGMALVLSLLAIAVVLAGIPSTIFDLDRHAIPKETLVHLGALVSGLMVLARGGSLRFNRVEWILLALLLWTAVGAIAATNPWLALRSGALTVSSVILFMVARRVAAAGRRLLLAGVTAALALGAVTALAQAYGFEIGVLAESRAPGGTFGNRNFMAHALVIGFPVLVAASRAALGPVARFGALAGLLVSGGAILLSRSRAAWLALVVGAAVLALGFRWLPWRRSPAEPRVGSRPAVGAVAAGILLALLLPNQLSWRSPTPYRDTLGTLTDYDSGSGRGRLIQYATSLRLVPAHPIVGTGAGNWVVNYPRVTRPGDPGFAGADPIPTNPWPSSDWVALLVERGGLAALLLLAAGAVFVQDIWRGTRDGATGLRAATALGVLGATLVVTLLDAVLQTAVPAVIVPLLLGALAPEEPAAGTPATITPSPRQRGIVAGLLVVAILGLVRTGMEWAAIRHVGSSRSTARLEEALRFDPWNYRIRVVLVQRGSCDRRRPHLRVLEGLLPWHPVVRAVRARCPRG